MTWRYSLIIPIAALAYLAGANAVVNATRVGAPGTALAINASDGGALVAQSNQKWAAGVQQGKVLDLSGAARKALRTAPLSGGALRLMGQARRTPQPARHEGHAAGKGGSTLAHGSRRCPQRYKGCARAL